MSVTESNLILQAAESLERGEVVGLGDYVVSSNGKNSSSKKSVLAETFVSYHEISSGDRISMWMHGETGALIILPAKNE